MSGPYDALVRMQKRGLDQIRLSIGVEINHADQVARAQDALIEEIEGECLAAQGDWTISTAAYLRDRAARTARLVQSKREHEEALDRLRQKAGEAYGALRVAERAAALHALREEQARMRKAQAEADDLANARRLLRMRAHMRRLDGA